MDPIEQILAQGRVGQASEGPSPQYLAYQHGFDQAQQTGLAKQRIAIEQQTENRQQKAQDALLPFQVAQAKQAVELNTLNLQTQWQQHQALLDGGKDAADAFATMSSMAREDEDPVRVSAVAADFLAKNPTLAGSPPAKALTDFAQNYTTAALRKDQIDATIKYREEAIQQREDASKLNNQTKLDVLQKRLETGTSGGVKNNYFDRLQKMRDEADAETDPLRRSQLRRATDLFQSMVAPNRDNMGKVESESVFLNRQLPGLMAEFANNSSDPAIKGKSVMERRQIAIDRIKADYRNMIDGLNAAKQEPENQSRSGGAGFGKLRAGVAVPQLNSGVGPVAGATNPASQPITPVAEWKPGVGVVLPGGQVLTGPVTGGTQTPTSAQPPIANLLRSRGWSDTDIQTILDDAAQDPNGRSAQALKALLETGTIASP